MQTKYFFQLTGLSALWGMSFMLTRIAAPDLGPNLAACIRMMLACVVLATIMRVLGQRWPWKHWRELLLLGLLAVAGPHLLYARSSLELPAGYGALLSVTAGLFGAFASALLKEEPLSASKLLGCFLGFAGAAMVVRLGPVEPTPALVIAALTCVGGAAFSGVSTPYLKKAIQRMEPISITAGMHLMGMLLMVPGALMDLPQAHFTLSAIASVSLLGIATSGFAYWMYMRIMRHVPPMAALSSTYMSTGFGVLWAVVFLGEATGLIMVLGGILILVACLLVSGLNPWSRNRSGAGSKPDPECRHDT